MQLRPFDTDFGHKEPWMLDLDNVGTASSSEAIDRTPIMHPTYNQRFRNQVPALTLN